MLALSRSVGQKIILSTSDGEIEVCFIQSNTLSNVVIGINAPASVQIAREELLTEGNRKLWREGHRGD